VEWVTGESSLLIQALPALLMGTAYTLLFALTSMVLGLMLGALVALVRLARVPFFGRAAVLYVSCMRGTPLLVQIFVVYYGLPSIGIRFDPLTAGILALTLNVAAYLSESMRGAIAAIPRGQWYASSSLGLDRRQTMRYVIAPQALRVAVPSLSNSLISLIKDTSLVSVIGVTELMLASKEVISTTFRPLPLYLAAAAIYWGLSLLFERAQGRLERRLNRPHEVVAR
jgi:cystine transport system permease protein